METVGKFSLKNEGGFVTELKFVYLDSQDNMVDGTGTGGFGLGSEETADPGDYGVPDGSRVYLYAFVVWGEDNQAKQVFKYQKGNNRTAKYKITGMTLNNELTLIGVE